MLELLNSLSLSSPLVILTIFLTPILVLAGLIVALAAVGTSLGLRKMYVKALLKVFEVSHPQLNSDQV